MLDRREGVVKVFCHAFNLYSLISVLKEFIKSINIYLPPIELQTQFADFVKQVDKSRFITSKEKIRRVKFYDKF